MKRRHFLSLLGAGAVAPALPGISMPAAAAGYNRYQYGLAVFHARTHGQISAGALAARLKLSPAQASAMMAEMSAQRVVSGGVVAQPMTQARPYLRRALQQLDQKLTEVLTDPDLSSEIPEIADAAAKRCTDGAQVVHNSHRQPAAPNHNIL